MKTMHYVAGSLLLTTSALASAATIDSVRIIEKANQQTSVLKIKVLEQDFAAKPKQQSNRVTVIFEEPFDGPTPLETSIELEFDGKYNDDTNTSTYNLKGQLFEDMAAGYPYNLTISVFNEDGEELSVDSQTVKVQAVQPINAYEVNMYSLDGEQWLAQASILVPGSEESLSELIALSDQRDVVRFEISELAAVDYKHAQFSMGYFDAAGQLQKVGNAQWSWLTFDQASPEQMAAFALDSAWKKTWLQVKKKKISVPAQKQFPIASQY